LLEGKKMKKQMTHWFPSWVKPFRSGVYEVFTPNSNANKFAYFDEKGWRLCGYDIFEAEGEINWPDSLSSMNLPRSKWRGFTEEQK
jgi:hypothetical protein